MLVGGNSNSGDVLRFLNEVLSMGCEVDPVGDCAAGAGQDSPANANNRRKLQLIERDAERLVDLHRFQPQ